MLHAFPCNLHHKSEQNSHNFMAYSDLAIKFLFSNNFKKWNKLNF